MVAKKSTPPAKKERKLHGRNDATGVNSDAKKPAPKAPGKAVAVKPSKLDIEARRQEKITVGEKKLAPIATEINVRLEKANDLKEKSNDHRLAAALKLEEARKIAEEAGVKFKEWCEANVKQSYETIRRLVSVAQSEEPAKALADMREANAKANKQARARKKAASRDAVSTKAIPPARRALEALDGCKDDEALKLVTTKAEALGHAIVPTAELKKLKTAATKVVTPDAVSGTVQALQEAFGRLKPSEKMTFLRWATVEVGCVLQVPEFDVDEALSIPEGFKR